MYLNVDTQMRSQWRPSLWMTCGADSLDIFQIIMGIEEDI